MRAGAIFMLTPFSSFARGSIECRSATSLSCWPSLAIDFLRSRTMTARSAAV